jgi:hypothetical protein
MMVKEERFASVHHVLAGFLLRRALLSPYLQQLKCKEKKERKKERKIVFSITAQLCTYNTLLLVPVPVINSISTTSIQKE